VLRLPSVVILTAVLFVVAPTTASSQNAPSQQSSVDERLRDRVIDGILDALDREYVFPEKAAEMRRSIAARRAAGAYASVVSGAELAAMLTTDLQNVSKDKHLRVRYTRGAVGPDAPPDRRVIDALNRLESSAVISGAEILPGNIGYVEVRTFAFSPDQAADAVAKAMTTVADADALIIDIRRNGGGSPRAVQLVSSYLFGEDPVHLNSLYFRPADRTDDFHTLRSVAGKRYGPNKPVYVLTSRSTFSAAEEFAYNLQSRKRAVIVGDTTGGGAHPGGMQRVSDDFAVFVPRGRAINPITKTNWEGVGVRPEIAVSADSALSAALAHARRGKKPVT
jgi:retinol-binding protein 3